MKIHLGFASLIILFVTSCTSVVDVAKKELEIKTKPFQDYKDRIKLIDFGNEDLDQNDSIKNKITREITAAAAQNFDAVILNSNNLSKSLLSSTNAELKQLNSVRYAGDLARKLGLNLFIAINFNESKSAPFSAAQRVEVKNNFSMLVKNCEIDGYHFEGINFLSAEDSNLFENIIVESMLSKPFLIVMISENFSINQAQAIEKYLEKGVIDFLNHKQADYAIQKNKYLSSVGDEKILKSYIKRLTPDHFIALNLQEIIDESINEIEFLNEKRTKRIDDDKKLNLISSEKSDTIKLKIENKIYNISKSEWVIPFNYLLNKDNSVSRFGNWVEFRRPFARISNEDIYNLLCRTAYPSKVFINDDSVKIYKTGVFFKKIKLKEGLNKLRAEVKDNNGTTAIYEDRVLYQKKDLSKVETELSINNNSIEPAENTTLMPEDYITVSFNGTKSQKAFVEFNPGAISFECQMKNFNLFSKYQIQIPLKGFSKNQKYSIKLIMKPSENISSIKPIEKTLDYFLMIKDQSDFPLLSTTQDNSILTFTLAPIRLGAPIRNELPKNVILRSNGIFGDYYRVKLSDEEEGFINREFINELPPNSKIPSYFINPISCYPSSSADIVKIPYLENVPYEVYPDPQQKRIVITLYGVKTSSTWIIHKSNLRFIEEITWQQTSRETYKIYLNLKTSKIWGYELKPNGRELVFKLKYPPAYNLDNSLPLKGIKISLEAGHGGSNIGAVGLSGLKEKEINLDLSKKLEVLFKKHGAEILQVRDSDKDMTLLGKRDAVTNSDANIHLSIHANSSEPINEFLGTSGTCTFYHNPFWATFAEKVYDRMTELDLKPFGSVGSFNYRVTRMSEMPAILVEQAFMSNAEDEEKLNDDNFRQQMAEKIYDGLLDYLKYMSN